MTPIEKLSEVMKTSEIHWFNSAVNISLRDRFVFVENPKVASSTIKSRLHANALSSLKNIRVGPHPDIANSPFIKPYQLPDEALAEYLFGPDFFRFTFVRNPFNRLLSSYLDKIVGSAQEKGYVDGFWKRKYGSAKEQYTFSEFVEYIAESPDNMRDKHWRTQHRITLSSYIDYTFVGRFEMLTEHLLHVNDISGIDFSNIKEISPHKTNANSKLREFYTDDITERVRNIYKIDFDTFCYASELPT